MLNERIMAALDAEGEMVTKGPRGPDPYGLWLPRPHWSLQSQWDNHSEPI